MLAYFGAVMQRPAQPLVVGSSTGVKMPTDALTSSQSAPANTTAFVDLPPELLKLVLLELPFMTVASAACVCRDLRQVAHENAVWQHFIAQFFPDVEAVTPRDDRRALFRHLAQADGQDGVRCAACRGRLLLPDTGERCPCVARRTTRLPLSIGALCPTRAGSSALSLGGFDGMLSTLRERFVLGVVQELASLDSLAGAGAPDVLILCTTEGPALGASEQRALADWLQRGGALITSAFANWSAFNHYARDTVGFLGIQTHQGSPFHPRLRHRLAPPTNESGTTDLPCVRRLLVDGPFGAPRFFTNVGESLFTLTDAALGMGAVPLVESRSLVFYPPNDPAVGGVTGKGRALVCSNYHWLVDAHYWNGGTFHEAEQQMLLLNFIAGHVAARRGPVAARQGTATSTVAALEALMIMATPADGPANVS
jgi:hypothetical protein